MCFLSTCFVLFWVLWGLSSGTYNELDAKFSNEEDSVGDHNDRGD